VSLLIAILTLMLLGLVVLVVGAPLRGARRAGDRESVASPPSGPDDGPAPQPAPDRDELEAAREAKYREIRDAELDYRTGKLSLEDYEAIDGELREAAIDILNRLEVSDRPAAGDPRESESGGAPG
jgi:hypothetical protein